LAITRLFLKKNDGASTIATSPNVYEGKNKPEATDNDASRIRAMAFAEAKKVIHSGGTTVEAVAAAKEAALRTLSLSKTMSVDGRTLTRGKEGKDCDANFSSTTSIAKDEVALNQECMPCTPISYSFEKRRTAHVFATPGKEEITVNRDSKIHNASILDKAIQYLAHFVDAVDERIEGCSQHRVGCCLSSGNVTVSAEQSSMSRSESGVLEKGIDYNPNRRDTTIARAMNTNAGQSQMQQQQQINHPAEMYLPHTGAASLSNIVHYHQLSPSMPQINQASLQQMPQRGTRKCSQSRVLEKEVDHYPNW
jgi:hypothetical protein